MNEIAALVLTVVARLSWYDPSTCDVSPTNCYDPAQWWNMSGGLYDAREWYGRALACPSEFPIGTTFLIRNSRWGLADGTWQCLDRGGRIVIDKRGVVWLDLLTDAPIWADTLPVVVILPPGTDIDRIIQLTPPAPTKAGYLRME